MDQFDFWLTLGKTVAIFALLLNITILLVWVERKVLADMQDRLGPTRAGPYGILQTVADGLKLFFKEQVTPRKVELGAYLLAPTLAVITAFLLFLVVPIGRPFTVETSEGLRLISLNAMDLNVGLLFILAVSSTAVYAIVLAGWSSGSKYPLLGGVRGTAQAISYEAAMGLALVSVAMYTALTNTGGGEASLSIVSIIDQQQGTWAGFIPRWNIFPLFIPFVVFAIAAVAETNRAPFDLVEAEQEIVGGFHTEYSGMRFALFFLAEYVNMFTMSAIGVSLFLGGWGGPFLDQLDGIPATLLSMGYFFAKVFVLIFVYIWLRASLPRMRYDQLMDLGWKRLIPVALAWLILSTVVLAVRTFGLPWA